MGDPARIEPVERDRREASEIALRGSDLRRAPLEIKTLVDSRGTALIVLAGELDLSSAGLLLEAVELLATRRVEEAVIDLRGVTFICSTGVRALLEASERIGDVRLRAPSDRVRHVIELCGLGGVLTLER